ncbi:MAG: hypothetical protein ABID64_01925 [Nitrospirota bacterium]
MENLHKKYATSIFEYAAKFGGLSRSAVETRLRLEPNLADKPHLKAAIKEVGVNKVAMIARLATPETDEIFADKIRHMSKPAVQTLSKELRKKENITDETVCQAVPEKIKLELDEEMTFLFLKLKEKWNLTNKEVTKMILEKTVNDEFPASPKSLTGQSLTSDQEPRHIRIKRKRETLKKTNGKCAYPNCNRPIKNLHHQDRYSTTKNHKNITGLCHEHHEFAHNGLIPNENENPNKWKINIKAQIKHEADILYRKYRQAAML